MQMKVSFIPVWLRTGRNLLACHCLVLSPPTIADDSFLQVSKGKWSKYSRAIYSIYGDISISKDRLDFSLIPSFQYEILREEKSFVILKLNRSIDCNSNYLRLGPIREKFTSKLMEFSMIPRKHIDTALVSNEIDQEKLNTEYSCSWGVYIR